MHDIDETLPDLMRRATDGLEPDSTDLVRRGMERGKRLRRRRTAGLSIAATCGLVLTGAVAVAAQSIGPGQADPQVAGTPGQSVVAPTPKPSAKAVTPKDTLATLRKVRPATVRLSEQRSWGVDGFTAASVTVDDGKGLAEVSAFVESGPVVENCPTGDSRTCQVLSDGSVLLTETMARVYRPGHPNDRGVSYNSAQLHRPDGVQISLTSYNSQDEKDSPKTRQQPPFSAAQLTSMARSPLWKAAPAKQKAKGGYTGDPGKIVPTKIPPSER